MAQGSTPPPPSTSQDDLAFQPMAAFKETKVACSPQGHSSWVLRGFVEEISPPPGLYENSCLDLTCNLEPDNGRASSQAPGVSG